MKEEISGTHFAPTRFGPRLSPPCALREEAAKMRNYHFRLLFR
jgi:hypothetical protein